MKARDWHVRVWDVKHGASYDLLGLSNRRRLLKLVKQAALVHLAPPCGSFSGPRRGKLGSPGGPLRSWRYPNGLPTLTGVDAQKVIDGNRLLSASLSIVRACLQLGTPITFENPQGSRMWWTPQFAKLLSKGSHVLLDFLLFWHKVAKVHSPRYMEH